LSTAAYIFGIW